MNISDKDYPSPVNPHELDESINALKKIQRKHPDISGGYTPEWAVGLEFDYDEYQPARSDCPESDAKATLIGVYLFGQDITEIATKDKDWVQGVESDYLESRAKGWGEDDGYGDYLYDQRKDQEAEERR